MCNVHDFMFHALRIPFAHIFASSVQNITGHTREKLRRIWFLSIFEGKGVYDTNTGGRGDVVFELIDLLKWSSVLVAKFPLMLATQSLTVFFLSLDLQSFESSALFLSLDSI
jgi:hypothetical protein